MEIALNLPLGCCQDQTNIRRKLWLGSDRSPRETTAESCSHHGGARPSPGRSLGSLMVA